MKILITGASGLLGSDVRHSAVKRNYACVNLASSSRDGFVKADISTAEGLAVVESLEWDAMVHAAAWRSPEACEKDPAGAYAVNAEATGKLAALAAARKAPVVCISTDYVFPGTNPPYAEDSAPSPLNTYGKTKLAGEQAALKANPAAAILRIPFLFGWRAGLQRCSLLVSALDVLNSPVPKGVDDSVVRYPTCSADVAEAIMLILERKSSGIHHFSSGDKTTRYGIAVAVAELLGRDASRIERLSDPPSSDSPRPKDSHLSMAKLLSMGCTTPPPFRERMKECLAGLGLLRF